MLTTVQCCFTSSLESVQAIRDRQSRMATSTSTQLLSSDVGHKAAVNFVEHQQAGCIICIVQVIKACPLQTFEHGCNNAW